MHIQVCYNSRFTHTHTLVNNTHTHTYMCSSSQTHTPLPRPPSSPPPPPPQHTHTHTHTEWCVQFYKKHIIKRRQLHTYMPIINTQLNTNTSHWKQNVNNVCGHYTVPLLGKPHPTPSVPGSRMSNRPPSRTLALDVWTLTRLRLASQVCCRSDRDCDKTGATHSSTTTSVRHMSWPEEKGIRLLVIWFKMVLRFTDGRICVSSKLSEVHLETYICMISLVFICWTIVPSLTGLWGRKGTKPNAQ